MNQFAIKNLNHDKYDIITNVPNIQSSAFFDPT